MLRDHPRTPEDLHQARLSAFAKHVPELGNLLDNMPAKRGRLRAAHWHVPEGLMVTIVLIEETPNGGGFAMHPITGIILNRDTTRDFGLRIKRALKEVEVVASCRSKAVPTRPRGMVNHNVLPFRPMR